MWCHLVECNRCMSYIFFLCWVCVWYICTNCAALACEYLDVACYGWRYDPSSFWLSEAVTQFGTAYAITLMLWEPWFLAWVLEPPGWYVRGQDTEGEYIRRTNDVKSQTPMELPDCSICMNDIFMRCCRHTWATAGNRALRLECGHYFHHFCIVNWHRQQVLLKRTPTCPMCRERIWDVFHTEVYGFEYRGTWVALKVVGSAVCLLTVYLSVMSVAPHCACLLFNERVFDFVVKVIRVQVRGTAYLTFCLVYGALWGAYFVLIASDSLWSTCAYAVPIVCRALWGSGEYVNTVVYAVCCGVCVGYWVIMGRRLLLRAL